MHYKSRLGVRPQVLQVLKDSFFVAKSPANKAMYYRKARLVSPGSCYVSTVIEKSLKVTNPSGVGVRCGEKCASVTNILFTRRFTFIAHTLCLCKSVLSFTSLCLQSLVMHVPSD